MNKTSRSAGFVGWAYSSLPFQILAAVALGIVLGVVFPPGALKSVSEVGRLIIHWVKLIAGPFLFLTIVSSLVEVRLGANHAVRLVAIACANTAIAVGIGMGLAHLFLGEIRFSALSALIPHSDTPATTGTFSFIKTFTPPSLFSPFVQNEILIIAFLALMTGVALRQIYVGEGTKKLRAVASLFEEIQKVPAAILGWLIRIIPLAVLAVVAGSVSEHGLEIFITLFRYVGVVLLGFCLQVSLVYGFWILFVARIPLRVFWRAAKAPVLYAFGVNSSLATLPLTLAALKELKISATSASLGAGVATNLNNDGIVLYEALAVYFVAQLAGIPMSDTQMVVAALACIVASAGITGIPEAGFISLSIVVSTLGLPAEALPLLLAVDWMIARGRSVVNVLSDMTLSIALEATEKSVPVTARTRRAS